MSVPAILLAAGQSRRMRGADKLLEKVRGVPLLRDRAQMLLDASVQSVIVVLPGDKPDRLAALDGLAVTATLNTKAQEGMASSIQAGLAMVDPKADGALILPADMPDVTAEDVARVISRFEEAPTKIIRGASDGKGGSPVIFPRRFFPELMQLSGDKSGRDVIGAHAEHVCLVPLPGTHARLDLDTPEAWAEWRKAQAGTT